MITKVAKTQALREAFPNMFGSNVYIQEEVDMMSKNENKDFINTTVEEVNEKVKEDVATEEMPNYDEIYQKAIDNLYD